METLKVTVIVRTKNERRWIEKCVLSVLGQDSDFKVTVLVCDTGSTDGTIEVVERLQKSADLLFIRYPTNIDYRPGKVLNYCIEQSPKTDFFVFLSAHCIAATKNWLSNLVKFCASDKSLAGVYGRQIPLLSSTSENSRDLLMTFGPESRKNSKEFFFHNANSCIPSTVLKEVSFDEDLLHLEDRAWAANLIDIGYKIGYSAEAAVGHHHGLHQHLSAYSSFRSDGVNRVLHELEPSLVEQLKNLESFIIKNTKSLVVVQLNSDTIPNIIVDFIEALVSVNNVYICVVHRCTDQSVNRNIANCLEIISERQNVFVSSRAALAQIEGLETTQSLHSYLGNLVAFLENYFDQKFDSLGYLDDNKISFMGRENILKAFYMCNGFYVDYAVPTREIIGDVISIDNGKASNKYFNIENAENFLRYREDKKIFKELIFGAGSFISIDAILFPDTATSLMELSIKDVIKK